MLSGIDVMNRYLSRLCLVALLFVNGMLLASAAGAFPDPFVDTDGIVYKQAKPVDHGDIMELYDQLDTDDHPLNAAARDCLVVYPKEVRAFKLTQHILNRQIYIACISGKVVSICKLYSPSDDDLSELIEEELKAGEFIEEGFSPACPVFRLDYMLSQAFVSDFRTTFPRPMEIVPGADVRDIRLIPRMNDVFLYFGSAYTDPNNKHRGINTRLERYAFEVVVGKSGSDTPIRTQLQIPGSRLIYMYGVVPANFWKDVADPSQGWISTRLRSFSRFVCDEFFPDRPVPFSLEMFNTVKPVFGTDARRAQTPRPGSSLLLAHDSSSPSRQINVDLGVMRAEGSRSASSLLASNSSSPSQLPAPSGLLSVSTSQPVARSVQPTTFMPGYGCFVSVEITPPR